MNMIRMEETNSHEMTPAKSDNQIEQEYRKLVVELIKDNEDEIKEVRRILGDVSKEITVVKETLSAHKMALGFIGAGAGLFGSVVPYIIRALFVGLTTNH